MALIYFDCFSGVAGDMIIGALLDAGLPLEELRAQIAKLRFSGYELSARKVIQGQIAGAKFDVHVTETQPERNLKDIVGLIVNCSLDDDIKESSIKIFTRLGQAEAAVHNQPLDKVHFHEVGAVDSIIDICGAVIALKLLGIDAVFASPLPLGKGAIKSAHGELPNPAPATTALLKNIPVRITDTAWEQTTPTGAAILSTLANFSEPDSFAMSAVGYGAGSKQVSGMPNLLRVMIGVPSTTLGRDTVTLLEANLDRIPGENLGGMFEQLLSAGALDVFVTPVIMKKNRPGHLLSVLCDPDKKDRLAEIIFAVGKTLGLRVSSQPRIKLPRTEITIATSGGNVTVKVAEAGGQSLIFPEYDDMVSAMKKAGKDYDNIYFEIQRAMRKE